MPLENKFMPYNESKQACPLSSDRARVQPVLPPSDLGEIWPPAFLQQHSLTPFPSRQFHSIPVALFPNKTLPRRFLTLLLMKWHGWFSGVKAISYLNFFIVHLSPFSQKPRWLRTRRHSFLRVLQNFRHQCYMWPRLYRPEVAPGLSLAPFPGNPDLNGHVFHISSTIPWLPSRSLASHCYLLSKLWGLFQFHFFVVWLPRCRFWSNHSVFGKL